MSIFTTFGFVSPNRNKSYPNFWENQVFIGHLFDYRNIQTNLTENEKKMTSPCSLGKDFTDSKTGIRKNTFLTVAHFLYRKFTNSFDECLDESKCVKF